MGIHLVYSIGHGLFNTVSKREPWYTADALTTQGLGVPTFPAVENSSTIYSWPSVHTSSVSAGPPNLRLYLTVVFTMGEKNPHISWTCTVQTYVVQGSAAYSSSLFFFYLLLPGRPFLFSLSLEVCFWGPTRCLPSLTFVSVQCLTITAVLMSPTPFS